MTGSVAFELSIVFDGVWGEHFFTKNTFWNSSASYTPYVGLKITTVGWNWLSDNF